MISPQQKSKILQVVNVFETGSPQGKYDSLTIFADGINATRQITFGRSQTTEQGNLKALIQLYISKKGTFAPQFAPFVNLIGKQPLVDNAAFKSLLRKSAREDAIMRSAQDDFFDVLYYQPAFHFFEKNLFTLALSLLVIYDSYIHSGSIPAFLREKFPESVPLNGGNEKNWITQYVAARKQWLANHTKQVLRNTVYRMECCEAQIKTNNWDLAATVVAHGVPVV